MDCRAGFGSGDGPLSVRHRFTVNGASRFLPGWRLALAAEHLRAAFACRAPRVSTMSDDSTMPPLTDFPARPEVIEQLALTGPGSARDTLRPIHYLGNKSRVLNAIESAVGSVAGNGGLVCDLFAGSGVVAQRLGQHRSVIASDIQEYSRVITSALLNPTKLPSELLQEMMHEVHRYEQDLRKTCPPGLFTFEDSAIGDALSSQPESLCDIIEHGSTLAFTYSEVNCPEKLAVFLRQMAADIPGGPGTVITRYYGGVYYSYHQAIALDALAKGVRGITSQYRDVATAALLSTASELVSTVGNQFAQPVRPRLSDKRPKAGVITTIARKRQRSVIDAYCYWLNRYNQIPPAEFSHQVIRGDFRNILTMLPDDLVAIYADPPYTRDHYSRFYHVLETLALGDEPEVSTMKVGHVTQLSRALYRKERHQSPFCIKSQVQDAFHDLFSAATRLGVPLVLSYSPHSPGTAARPSTRLLTVPRLLDLGKEHFSEIRLQSTGRIAHSKLNVERLNAAISYGAELLLVGIP
jgi:adenine-specific DNA-methyltransferase